MRILVTIAHFYQPQTNGNYASQGATPVPRLQALSQSITALHELFDPSQCWLHIEKRAALPANQPQAHELDVVICTTQDHHLLHQLPVLPSLYTHHPTHAEPLFLGFECQAVLRERLGHYDYYCFLEDDLILHDPYFFVKLNWFTQQMGDRCLLQPNRYEVSSIHPLTRKAYVDGDLAPHITAPFQNIQERAELRGTVLGAPILFQQALNPHAGCYFLNAQQMAYWVEQPHFLDRDTRFIGPLESAATLGILKTFQVYKSAPEQAGFLEIQHFGSKFLNLVGNEVQWIERQAIATENPESKAAPNTRQPQSHPHQ